MGKEGGSRGDGKGCITPTILSLAFAIVCVCLCVIKQVNGSGWTGFTVNTLRATATYLVLNEFH